MAHHRSVQTSLDDAAIALKISLGVAYTNEIAALSLHNYLRSISPSPPIVEYS